MIIITMADIIIAVSASYDLDYGSSDVILNYNNYSIKTVLRPLQ